jgi:hypothetical protein
LRDVRRPDGTWASLTKRQRSKLNKFRWRPGLDGPERDEHGNAIIRLPNGCVVVNLSAIGCPLGTAEDLRRHVRQHAVVLRRTALAQDQEGNGTEPETVRPLTS